MKKIRKWIDFVIQYIKTHKRLVGALLVALIVLVFMFKPKGVKPITTVKVEKGNITKSISITGSVDSENSVNLTFQIPGTLNYIAGKKGDPVYAYQTLATLDERSSQKNLEQTLIDYSKQRINFDQTLETYQNRTPEQALNNAVKRILQNNQYDLDKAIGSVELQDLAKQKSVLTSPISGILTRADVDTPGVNITTASTYTVTDLNSIIFKMDVDEADIGNIKTGQTVKVELNAYSNETLKLTVDKIGFVSHMTSTGSTAFSVESKMSENNGYKYRIGMSGNAEIILKESRNALTIPNSSIIEDNKVFIKTKNGIEQKTIKLGIQGDTKTEVLSGLSEKDFVFPQPSALPKTKKTSILFIDRLIRR